MTEKEEISNKENAKADDSKSVEGKDKKSKNGRDKVKPLTKIVIRRLPPTMTEETFLKQIEPLPDNDYFYYVPADWSLGPNATCRAYINFVNQDDIFIFRDKFDGYIFVDQKGTDFQAIVEYAPFQGLPKNRARKKDNKSNSIETDQHYISFVEALQNEQNSTGTGETKLEFSYQFSTSKDDIKKITNTPLLDFLANKKQERKRRSEEQRKQRREDEKQKRKEKVVKSIPSVIQEEEPNSRILVDDGIVTVRAIKSRLDRGKNSSSNSGGRDGGGRDGGGRDGSGRDGGGRDGGREGRREKPFDAKVSAQSAAPINNSDRKDDNRRSYKDYKEERKRRDEKRRQEREQRKSDSKKKDSEKGFDEKAKPILLHAKDEGPIQPVTASKDTNTPAKDAVPPLKKEIKKYSEVRKERRARASASQAEPAPQDNVDNKTSFDSKSAESLNSDKYTSYNDDVDEIDGFFPKIRADIDPKETMAQRLQRESDERTARRIRNKDRPSREIYRPGKLRTGSKKISDDEKGGKDSPDSDCDRNLSSSRRNSSKSLDDNDEVVTPKSEETPALIAETKEKKLYEMSPDIPPFIPKSMQAKVEQQSMDEDVDVGPGQ